MNAGNRVGGVNGHRRVALDVALANGLTRDQYVEIVTLAGERLVWSLGGTAERRRSSVKQLIRQGLINRGSVRDFLTHLRTLPRERIDEDQDITLLKCLHDIVKYATSLLDQELPFTDVQHAHLVSAHDSLVTAHLRRPCDDDDGSFA